jgi:hypothetical protein
VRHAITRVQHDTCGATAGVQRQHGLQDRRQRSTRTSSSVLMAQNRALQKQQIVSCTRSLLA